MNWKLIAALSFFAVAMGCGSVLGMTAGIEPFLWAIVWLVCAFVISRKAKSKPFLHGFFVGLSHGIVNSVIQSAFFDTYLNSNPQLQNQFGQIPGGLAPQVFVLLAGPVIGAASGAVIGLLATIGSKLLRK